MFKKNISRFIAIIFIVFISVGLTSGVGSSTDDLKDSVSVFKTERNVGDITLKSSSESGFSTAEVAALKKKYGEENVSAYTSYDVYLQFKGQKLLTRLYFYDDIAKRSVNKFSDEDTKRQEAAAPKGMVGVYAEKADNVLKGFSLGDEVTLNFADMFAQLAAQDNKTLPEWQKTWLDKLSPVTLSVTKIVEDPRLFAKEGEPSYLNGYDLALPDMSKVNDLITLDEALFLPMSALPLASGYGDVSISLASLDAPELLSSDYEKFIDDEKGSILSILSDASEGKTTKDSFHFITLYENYSFKSLFAYADKIRGLSFVLVVAFSFITVLVTLSNMTRLVDEERAQSACLITLGYSGASVVIKYILFALTATAIGGVDKRRSSM